MAPRLELDAIFRSFIDHVYFQPPSNLEMQFPCIRYERYGTRTIHADNKPYSRTKQYQVTVIDRNPDSELPDLVESLPLSTINRVFVANGLHHHVFTLFF